MKTPTNPRKRARNLAFSALLDAADAHVGRLVHADPELRALVWGYLKVMNPREFATLDELFNLDVKRPRSKSAAPPAEEDAQARAAELRDTLLHHRFAGKRGELCPACQLPADDAIHTEVTIQ